MTRSALALAVTAALGGVTFAPQAISAVLSSSPALAIPDNQPLSPACDIIDASSLPPGATVDSVEVRTEIDHTWVGDLIITLERAGGPTVTLLDRPNVPLGTFGCSNNDADVRFADGEADPESICSGDPPQGNSADAWPVTDASPVPGSAMADFNGADANVNWTLCVSDNAGGDTGTLQSWELTINPAPAVSLSVPSVNFGTQDVGSPGAPSVVTIENTGDSNLDLGVLGLVGANAGDFGISADSCSGVTLAPAATCSFDVTATPSAAGVRSASVNIPSNAPSGPDSLPLEVTGNLPAPAVPVPVNSAWATSMLAVMLGLLGWMGLRRTPAPPGRRKP